MIHRPYLKYEPRFRPDGNIFYKHVCQFCQEGLPCETSECLGCGFTNEMLDTEFEKENRQIISDFHTNNDYTNAYRYFMS